MLLRRSNMLELWKETDRQDSTAFRRFVTWAELLWALFFYIVMSLGFDAVLGPCSEHPHVRGHGCKPLLAARVCTVGSWPGCPGCCRGTAPMSSEFAPYVPGNLLRNF
eukprot:3936860-Amphidinium_carterae.2